MAQPTDAERLASILRDDGAIADALAEDMLTELDEEALIELMRVAVRFQSAVVNALDKVVQRARWLNKGSSSWEVK